MDAPILKDYLTESEIVAAHEKASSSTYFGHYLADLTKDELLVLIWREAEEHQVRAKQHERDARFLGYLDGHLDTLRGKIRP